MQSAFEILSARPQIKKERSKRDTIIADIYAIYTNELQRKLRKKENWVRYISYLKENHIKHSSLAVYEFRRKKQFIKELPISTIAILLARNKEQRLFEILSEAKNLNGRGYNASAFIFANRFV